MNSQTGSAQDSQSHQVAERAALQSITDTFRLLGIDIMAMEDLNDLRDDFRFIRRMRQSDEVRRTEITKSAVAALVGGLIGMIVSAASWMVAVGRHAQ